MFNKILIANRGEIACRVIGTARRLGIATVAVHSRPDATALHVALADEAVAIGAAAASDSYLRGDRVIDAARRTGAEAIHPGYGFLSENADFAQDCAAAGLVFIGPGPAAIRAMGSKSAARKLMKSAGIPLIHGYHGDDQSDNRMRAEADRIGYPVLIKASSGGGGRGMRVVADASGFDAALGAARRESSAAFGDDHMLVEQFVNCPRHIEVQVFADAHGNVLHLFERDCSVQRRHQKIIEEAPAPGLPDAQRASMAQAAVDAAKAVDYVGAGTVEFIVDQQGRFYFMEMNTRLQVEHPVTERITGQDLVEWQLLVAAGDPLPVSQDELKISGHAIEARLCAEDPVRDFLPATGELLHLRLPSSGPHVRVDAGVREGDAVSIHYDSLIAKLIVWSEDRAGAVRHLQMALRKTRVVGVTTNLEFLNSVAAHEAFTAGGAHTRFLDDHRGELLGGDASTPEVALVIAAVDVVLRQQQHASRSAAVSADPNSPWYGTTGWRVNKRGSRALLFVVDGEAQSVTVEYGAGEFRIGTPAGLTLANGQYASDGELIATLDGCRRVFTVVRRGNRIAIFHRNREYGVEYVDPGRNAGVDAGATGGLVAPMPGRVIVVKVKEGDRIRSGDTLLILEAMKVEHAIVAPIDGVVERLLYAQGDLVDEGEELLILAPADQAPKGQPPNRHSPTRQVP